MINEEIKTKVLYYFPSPIARMYFKLFTEECAKQPSLKLDYILATAETISTLSGIIVLCECREYIEKSGVRLGTSLTNDFKERFMKPAWGSWLHFTEEGLKWLRESNCILTMPELHDFYFKANGDRTKAAASLYSLLTLRNKQEHGKNKGLTRSHFTQLCEEAFSILSNVLEPLNFIINYVLSFVSSIEIDKQRRESPIFAHNFKSITGSHNEFLFDSKELKDYMDTKVIVLKQSSGNSRINLDPLLVYQDTEGLSQDIFYYNGMNKSKNAVYSPCDIGKSMKVSAFERANVLITELEHLLILFNS
ncbi:MAG: hypothetical protein L3V56_11525 [Candidatus Magnetoovum sp. WYHC-5]|nr:hypothetical protein [Candidatus Magnetoovum sp. WYHC-5]